GLPAHEQAGAGEPPRGAFGPHVRVVAVGARPRVARPDLAEEGVPYAAAQGGHRAGARVDGTVLLDDPRADRRGVRPPAGTGDQLADRPFAEHDVRVAEHEELRVDLPGVTQRLQVAHADVHARAVPQVAAGGQEVHAVAS